MWRKEWPYNISLIPVCLYQMMSFGWLVDISPSKGMSQRSIEQGGVLNTT